MSKIEWTDVTWNPVTGCNKVSPGCKHCYAETMAKRLKAMNVERYGNGFSLTIHPDQFDVPRQWRKPRRVFVCSMSDLFHEEVPASVIWCIFATMHQNPQHQFQLLTKRPRRMWEIVPGQDWAPNIWAGTSVEDERYLPRVDWLRQVPAAVRFLSLEPLLGPLTALNLAGIDWVIVGGESGPGARLMDPAWARELRDQCAEKQIPFFFKQMTKKAPIPIDLQIREFPHAKGLHEQIEGSS